MGAGEGSWGRNGSFGELAQLDKLLPGDLVIFWGEGERLVRTLFLCREGVMGRTYEWRWLFLDDGTLLEISPDGYYRYRRHLLVKQGTPLYEELVAQDGALVRFEERVRAGVSGRRPVHVTVEDATTGKPTPVRVHFRTPDGRYLICRQADPSGAYAYYALDTETGASRRLPLDPASRILGWIPAPAG